MEWSYFDTVDSTDVVNVATVLTVNAMGQGVSSSTRVGNRIVMDRLEVTIQLNNEAAILHPRQPVRLVVVYDYQTNGAAPALLDVIKTYPLYGYQDTDRFDRFDILLDEIIDYNTFGIPTVTGSDAIMIERFSVLLGGLKTTYNAAAAGVASVTTGGLFVMVVGTSAAGTDDLNKFMTCQLRYLS